jgi:GNAT superfamily N-acetyltransferase
MNDNQIKQPVAKTHVNRVEHDDADAAINTILLAFSADPHLRWIWTEADAYHAYAPHFFKAFGGNAFKNDTAFFTRDFSGVSLWLPPGAHPNEESLLSLLEKTITGSKFSTIIELLGQMDRYHPDEPHWHLPLIGVDPAKQGSGYGSQLMQNTLDDIDRQGEIAYLENTNPKNTPFYERFGFKMIDVIKIDGAPPLFPMIRYPNQ